MPSAEIITIGTEILLGEIVDTNARYVARQLRDLGIDLYRKTTVGDNANRIAQAIQQAMQRCDIVLTTGGLGPTVDDPTRQAVAQAFEVELEFQPELWEQVKARFKRFGRIPTDNNQRQAYIPSGALAIENPVGTAPAFLVEKEGKVVISLPGVPREMEYLLDHYVLSYLRQRFRLTGIIKARQLHTVGVGESQIDDLIGDLEMMTNPTVGLAAHSGQVDVRITAKAASEEQADQMILPVELELRARLGDWIYGTDQDTLEETALKVLLNRGWSLGVVEYGIGGSLIHQLSHTNPPIRPALRQIFKGGEVLTSLTDSDELSRICAEYRQARQVDVCLGAAVFYDADKQDIHLVILTPEAEQSKLRSYGGPAAYAVRYAIHNSLDLLRHLDLQSI